jgi:uncharacterized membrane protein
MGRTVVRVVSCISPILVFAACDGARAPMTAPSTDLASSLPAAAGTYKAKDLGLLDGDNQSFAGALNFEGDVVGYSTGNPTFPNGRVFYRTASGDLDDMGFLDGSNEAQVNAVNDIGMVAGESGNHAAVWTRWTGWIPLPSFRGENYSEAYGITDFNEVLGESVGTTTHVFIWSPLHGTTDLRALDALPGVTACGLSPDGRYVVGSFVPAGSASPFASSGFIYDVLRRQLKVIGMLPGTVGTTACRVNRRGQVAGTSITEPMFGKGFVWAAGAGFQSFTPTGGTTQAFANGIDVSGDVLVTNKTPCNSAYVRATNGAIRPLPSLRPLVGGQPACDDMLEAVALNERAQVAGESELFINGGLTTHAVLWTASTGTTIASR